MSDSDSHFEEFQPHSRYKHRILKNYFEAWGRKLLLRQGATSTVVCVDACAGRGMDDVGNQGSPVIIAEAARSAEAQLRVILGREVRIQVIAIEENASNFRALTENLRPFGESVRALRGEFADHVPEIEREFAGAPTLWFIDPFGIEPLDSAVVRKALAGPKNEALIMFLDQGALRHLGVAVAQQTRTELELRRLDSDLVLFPDFHDAQRSALEPKLAKSRDAVQATKAKAIEIMDAALERRDWQQILLATPPNERPAKVLEMYTEVLVDAGARYVTHFPVLSAEGDHVYYLVHASKSGKARTAIKEAVEAALNHDILPPETVDALRGLLACDVAKVERFLRSRLRGTELRWARDPKDRSALCVKYLALEETEIYPSQLDELKARLKNLRLPGKSVVYRFPDDLG